MADKTGTGKSLFSGWNRLEDPSARVGVATSKPDAPVTWLTDGRKRFAWESVGTDPGQTQVFGIVPEQQKTGFFALLQTNLSLSSQMAVDVFEVPVFENGFTSLAPWSVSSGALVDEVFSSTGLSVDSPSTATLTTPLSIPDGDVVVVIEAEVEAGLLTVGSVSGFLDQPSGQTKNFWTINGSQFLFLEAAGNPDLNLNLTDFQGRITGFSVWSPTTLGEWGPAIMHPRSMDSKPLALSQMDGAMNQRELALHPRHAYLIDSEYPLLRAVRLRVSDPDNQAGFISAAEFRIGEHRQFSGSISHRFTRRQDPNKPGARWSISLSLHEGEWADFREMVQECGGQVMFSILLCNGEDAQPQYEAWGQVSESTTGRNRRAGLKINIETSKGWE